MQTDADFLSQALTSYPVRVRGEVIVKVYNKMHASAARDAAAKAIYGRLFAWLIAQMNHTLLPLDTRTTFTINILDIFGFEVFAHNSLEQLCINAANEQLQQFFLKTVFDDELQCYRREGLSAPPYMPFPSNVPLLRLLFGRPAGIFALLDEDSRLQGSSMQSLEQKLLSACSAQSQYFEALPEAFRITHYAGPVTYELDGLIEKNRDPLPEFLADSLANSSCPLLSTLFGSRPLSRGGSRMNLLSRSIRRALSFSAASAAPQSQSKQPTLAFQFKASLEKLLVELTECTPYFVRCIKPNAFAVPDDFRADYVRGQLRSAGMLAAVHIRRQGYAFRPTFAEFLQRFGAIHFGYTVLSAVPVTAGSCAAVLQRLACDDHVLGRTRVFLRYWHRDMLCALLVPRERLALRLQAIARAMVARKQHARRLAQARVETASAVTFFKDMMAAGQQLCNWQHQLRMDDEHRISRQHQEYALKLAAAKAAGAERKKKMDSFTMGLIAKDLEAHLQLQQQDEQQQQHQPALQHQQRDQEHQGEPQEQERAQQHQYQHKSGQQEQGLVEQASDTVDDTAGPQAGGAEDTPAADSNGASHNADTHPNNTITSTTTTATATGATEASVQAPTITVEAAADPPPVVPSRSLYPDEPVPDFFSTAFQRSRRSKRAEAVAWFKKTEVPKGAVVVAVTGPPSPPDTVSPATAPRRPTIAPWFHGIITRSAAETLLLGKPIGSFLIRVSETRGGYSLSVVTAKRVKHFKVIVTSPDSRYVLAGTKTLFPSLHALVEHHRRVPLATHDPCLTQPVEQVDKEFPDYAELLFDKGKIKDIMRREKLKAQEQPPAVPSAFAGPLCVRCG